MRRRGGYTIVELVLVIVILAVLGALAGPRFFDNAAIDERAYADELAGSLRYAQKVAVASGCRVRAEIAAGSYALTQQSPQAGHCNPADASFPLTVRLSTGEPMNGSAPGGVVAAPALTLVYDALGRTNLATNQTIMVGARSLTIQADSGLVTTP
ncbi:MAG: prepilin-type N-terminal cleavage/methylation domain-containing protein [Gammaproteobacteria bacterium]|nr:prepilin-type N-terminal cleavage/methylation domain-containing protein [Gammaproteobacteria bacterium]